MIERDSSTESRRILLAEDEPGLQEALALTLQLEGFDVVRASDGREALSRLKIEPCLIITDYMMPRMNGLELIRQIRSRPAFDDVPILLMSAALPRDVDRSIADAFLQKPVTIKRLLETVNGLLTPA
ncbi:response regulator [Proteobacteria bacterium 005FR1]|nr:response regulator [Proteobacteria bacterium 005FR1]